jgi:four helix bundle protein
MQDFTRLRVWHDARAFRKRIFEVTRSFPASERFGLTKQLLDAARSISANLAEGSGRATDRDFAKFVDTSLSSACECLDHLITAYDDGYLSLELFQELTQMLGPIRAKLINLLKRLQGE